MTAERKSKATHKTNRDSRGCLVALGVMLGCALSWICADLLYGTSDFRESELRLVMETYHFGSGLANLTGDTSVLENVATKRNLQRQIEHCSKGLCDGNGRPPYVVGEYFKVVRQTDEFAIVELEHRPIITELGRIQVGYVKLCYSLMRDGNDWRVDGAYLDCDGYLPDRYK